MNPSGSPSGSSVRGFTLQASPGTATGTGSSAAPFVLLLLYVALIYLRPFDYRQYEEAFEGVPLIPTLLGLMVFTWLAVGKKDFDAPQYPLMLALSGCIALSVLFATRWVGGFIDALLGFLPVLGLFLVAASSLDSLSRLRKMFLLVAVVCTFIAWHGIDQAENEVGWSGALPIAGRITYVGFMNDPNDLAMTLLIALPMALSFYRGRRGIFLSVLALSAAGTLLYAVFLTNSRGAVLAVGAMSLAYSIARFGPRKGLFVAPVLLALAVVFGPDRAGDISVDEDSASDRVEAWYDGFNMLKAYPLFGVGRGQFVEHHVRTAHNSFILALAELGLVGFFVWLSLLSISVAMLIKIIRTQPPPTNAMPGDPTAWQEHQRLARILLYSLTGCLTAAYFLSRTYVVILYLLIAMIVGLYQSARRHSSSLPSLSLRSIAKRLVWLEITAVFVLWFSTRVLLAFN